LLVKILLLRELALARIPVKITTPSLLFESIAKLFLRVTKGEP